MLAAGADWIHVFSCRRNRRRWSSRAGRVDWAVVVWDWHSRAHLGTWLRDSFSEMDGARLRAMHPPATVREYVAAGNHKAYQKTEINKSQVHLCMDNNASRVKHTTTQSRFRVPGPFPVARSPKHATNFYYNPRPCRCSQRAKVHFTRSGKAGSRL